MIDVAYAESMAQIAETGGGLLGILLMIVPIFAIWYFLLIRPQQKKAGEHKAMLDNLQRGNRVITTGGIYGTITRVKDDIIVLQIADQVKIEVAKSAIAGLRGQEKVQD
ncbi:MAG: preprotein translocase subunit YajC [Candidatus Tectomicrobia bacterium]|nr:preprotein translocase subunit YajC [Candidatus Tectomicrobia bacterium]